MPAELDIVATENRRLLREVKELRARVAAFESSRWLRMHPRFVLERLRGRVPRVERRADAPDAVSAPPPTSSAEDQLLTRFRKEVVARGSFRSDMVSGNFPKWERYMKGLEGRAAQILEIGSYEGMSACYFLWRLSDARLTCIDTFAGGPSFAARGEDVSGIEARFDQNVSLIDAARVRKLVGDSAHRLLELKAEGEQFDVVFVDGSDLALDVLVDAAMSWQLLAPGGLMIFDNYGWRSPLGEDPLFQPAHAVDAFLDLVGGHCDLVVKDNQVVVRRIRTTAPVQVPAPVGAPTKG